MKIKTEFAPVTIVLETEKELKEFRDLLYDALDDSIPRPFRRTRKLSDTVDKLLKYVK